MAQKYQVPLLSGDQQQFSESVLQLAASNRLGNLQAKYTNRKAGVSLLVFGLFFLLLMPVFIGVQVSEGFRADFSSILSLLPVCALFLGGGFLFSASGIMNLLTSDYACSEGFFRVRGRRHLRVTLALRWDEISEVWIGPDVFAGRGAVSTPLWVLDASGKKSSVRGEIWLRAGFELACRRFALRSSSLLASFQAGQPVTFARLALSQQGIALPQEKKQPARVLLFQEIREVSFSLSARKGYRRAWLSFTLHSHAKFAPVNVLSAVDAALLLLFLQTLSQGHIQCKYAGRTL